MDRIQPREVGGMSQSNPIQWCRLRPPGDNGDNNTACTQSQELLHILVESTELLIIIFVNSIPASFTRQSYLYIYIYIYKKKEFNIYRTVAIHFGSKKKRCMQFAHDILLYTCYEKISG